MDTNELKAAGFPTLRSVLERCPQPIRKRAETAVLELRKWRDGLANSVKPIPNLPRDRWHWMEYSHFIESVRTYWASHGADLLLAVLLQSEDDEAAAVEARRSIRRWVLACARELLAKDLSGVVKSLKLPAPLGERLIVSLTSAVRATLSDALPAYRQLVRNPLVLPPALFWGVSPRRKDAVDGPPTFGPWFDSDDYPYPWRFAAHYRVLDASGTEVDLAPKVAEQVAVRLSARWRELLGDGPKGWCEYLRATSGRPVWCAWALNCLVQNWSASKPSDHDRRYLRGQLVQVSLGYRHWLRAYFDPAARGEANDARLDDVYPILDIGPADPRALVGADGAPNHAQLHRVACFVWFALEQIGGQSEQPQPEAPKKRRPRHRGLVTQVNKLLEDNPGLNQNQMAKILKIAASTLSRNNAVQDLIRMHTGELPKGHRTDDGNIEAIAPED